MRCRLALSSGGNTSEGFDCSSIKRARELGLIRRKTQAFGLDFEILALKLTPPPSETKVKEGGGDILVLLYFFF
jgi:hypothetical protein